MQHVWQQVAAQMPRERSQGGGEYKIYIFYVPSDSGRGAGASTTATSTTGTGGTTTGASGSTGSTGSTGSGALWPRRVLLDIFVPNLERMGGEVSFVCICNAQTREGMVAWCEQSVRAVF